MATWKQNYAKARSVVWPTYLLAALCFWMAVSSVHDNGGQFTSTFVIWVAATFGFVISARRAKRKYGKKG